MLGEREKVVLRIGLGDTAGASELFSQTRLLWDLKRRAKEAEL